MKKRIFRKTGICLMVALMLCGCTRISGSVQSRLYHALADVQSIDADTATYRNRYYAYYIEPCVGRIEATATSDIFMYDGMRFVMNLNVPAMINDRYYSANTDLPLSLSEDTVVASAEGSYLDSTRHEYTFSIRVCDLEDQCVTFLYTPVVVFCGVSPMERVPALSAMMLKIARSVVANENSVVAAFSTKEIITYESTTIQLFDYIAPESGSIEELFTDYHAAGDLGDSDFMNPQEPSEETDDTVVEEEKEDVKEADEKKGD